jgi:hypothetical protein
MEKIVILEESKVPYGYGTLGEYPSCYDELKKLIDDGHKYISHKVVERWEEDTSLPRYIKDISDVGHIDIPQGIRTVTLYILYQ